jgi:mono/diheme cytochrome c family protein
VFVLAALGDRKLERHVDIAAVAVPLVTDAAAVERGGYLFRSRGCSDCHGADGTGKVVVENGKSMLIRAPNITAGLAARPRVPAGRLGAHHPPRRAARRPAAPGDAERGIQPLHRRRPRRGRRLRPPAAAEGRRRRDDPPAAAGARALRGGVFKDASEKIDHRLPPSQPVAEGVNAAHGAYVAQGCTGCHRADLSGGKIAGAPPSGPAAARLARAKAA